MFSYSEDAARSRATLIGNAIAETCPDEFPCSHLDGKLLLTFAGHSGKIPPDAELFSRADGCHKTCPPAPNFAPMGLTLARGRAAGHARAFLPAASPRNRPGGAQLTPPAVPRQPRYGDRQVPADGD